MNEYEKLRNLNKFKKWKFKKGSERFSYGNVMSNHTGTGTRNTTPPPTPTPTPSPTFPPPPTFTRFTDCFIIEDNENCNIPVADPPCSGRTFLGSKTFTNPFINSVPVRLSGLVNNDIFLKTTQFELWLRSQSPISPACYAGGVDYTFEVGPLETFSVSAYNTYGGCKNVNLCASFDYPVTCLYPVSALYDGRLTLEDLPNEIQLNPYDLNTSVSATLVRNGATYGPYDFGGDYKQYVTFVNEVFYEPQAGPQWVFGQVGREPDYLDNISCLFYQNEFMPVGRGPGNITDLFHDTYRATLTYYSTSVGLVQLPGGVFGSLPPEFNFKRMETERGISLGTWKGEPPAGYGYALEYITNDSYSGWTINGVKKQAGSRQNNPTGVYDLTAVKILIEVTEI